MPWANCAKHRFMKGLFAWVGFPSQAVRGTTAAPRLAGRTKWNYWKLWNLAIEGITSHTVMPLRMATYLGLLTAAGAALYLLEVVVRTLVWGNPVAGYPSLMAVVLFLGSAQLMTLGVIGEYLGRVFNETKGRPLYLVERVLPAEPGAEGRGALSVPRIVEADLRVRTRWYAPFARTARAGVFAVVLVAIACPGYAGLFAIGAGCGILVMRFRGAAPGLLARLSREHFHHA